MKKIKAGDTLIEVLFAFAILATIMGFTFTAAIQGYKNAVQAQNQTQATFLAQYQADALKTYRDSLDWDNPATQSFINGFTPPGPGIPSLPAMRDYMEIPPTPSPPFCMIAKTGAGLIRWETTTNQAECNSEVSALAPSLPLSQLDPAVTIVFSNPVRYYDPNPNDTVPGTFIDDNVNPDKVTATVTVTYDIPNADANGEVINTITLTREQ